jgi:hypothetical protein
MSKNTDPEWPAILGACLGGLLLLLAGVVVAVLPIGFLVLVIWIAWKIITLLPW